MKKKILLYKNYFASQYKYKITDRDSMIKEVELNYRWYYTLYRLLNVNQESRDSSILEVGSGVGGWYKLLKENGFDNYTGLEVDHDIAKFSKSNFLNINIQTECIEDYKSDRKFDLVFALASLEHLYDPISALRSLYRVMKKGGNFYAIVPTPTRGGVLEDPTHLFCLHPENWKRIFQLCGFSDFTYKYISYPLPYIWRRFKKMNIILPFKLPFNFNTVIMLECRKV